MNFFDTNSLILTRRLIILWVTMLTAPWEPVFDVVDDELDSRGVNVNAARL
jgi:hypothetical protein